MSEDSIFGWTFMFGVMACSLVFAISEHLWYGIQIEWWTIPAFAVMTVGFGFVAHVETRGETDE